MSSLKYRPRSGQLRKWHLSVPKASHWNKGMGAQSVRANISISSALQLNHKPSLSRTPKTLCTTHTAPAEAFRFMLTDRCNSPNSSMLSPLWKKTSSSLSTPFLKCWKKTVCHFKTAAQQPRSCSSSSPDCWTAWFLVGRRSARRHGYGRTKILHPEERNAKHGSYIIPQIKPKTLGSRQERVWLVMQGFSCE